MISVCTCEDNCAIISSRLILVYGRIPIRYISINGESFCIKCAHTYSLIFQPYPIILPEVCSVNTLLKVKQVYLLFKVPAFDYHTCTVRCGLFVFKSGGLLNMRTTLIQRIPLCSSRAIVAVVHCGMHQKVNSSQLSRSFTQTDIIWVSLWWLVKGSDMVWPPPHYLSLKIPTRDTYLNRNIRICRASCVSQVWKTLRGILSGTSRVMSRSGFLSTSCLGLPTVSRIWQLHPSRALSTAPRSLLDAKLRYIAQFILTDWTMSRTC